MVSTGSLSAFFTPAMVVLSNRRWCCCTSTAGCHDSTSLSLPTHYLPPSALFTQTAFVTVSPISLPVYSALYASVCMLGCHRVRSSSAKRPAERSAKTQIRSKTRLKSELDLATEIWSKNILRLNLGLSKVLRPDLSQETC